MYSTCIFYLFGSHPRILLLTYFFGPLLYYSATLFLEVVGEILTTWERGSGLF